MATTTSGARKLSGSAPKTAAGQRAGHPVDGATSGATAGDTVGARIRGFARRHWIFGLLLLAGVLLRAATVYAYWPAFWFRNDSNGYIAGASDPQPDGFGGANGIGYPAFLWLVHWTNSLAVVSIAQHVLGVALAVLIYAFLRRRGLPGWLASLGAATQLLDAQMVALEHYVLADSLFTLLITAAAILLLYNDKPGVFACVASSVLLVGGVLTRTIGIGLAGIFALYLIVRWAGWKRVVAFVLPVLVLLGGYLGWMHSEYGTFSFSRMQGLYLYSRTAQIADCDRLRLSAAERAFCPTTPVSKREDRGDWFLWNGPQMGLQRYTPAQQAAISGFAKQVIKQQPGDYLALVARDTAKYLLPGQPVTSWDTCVGGWWAMPAQLPDNSTTFQTRCKAL
ncbi:MAG: hypothetical protein J2O49_03885, partial [Sciscionella sp.]|nr:hypothetical protein [Sciscionella sp.]